jgi:mono/diheme cytochrome c family protein
MRGDILEPSTGQNRKRRFSDKARNQAGDMPMMPRSALLKTFALLLALVAAPATASAMQDDILVKQGRILAESLCADCHTFGGNRRRDATPPDLAAVGAMAQTTALSLRVFLRSSHANMPDIILDDVQIYSLIAFILDLGGK